MPEKLMEMLTVMLPSLLLAYLAFISVLAVILTVYDKIASKRRPEGRIRERNLMLVAFFGGSFAMFICMVLIRHKTRHMKFMLGIPLFIAIHLAVIIGLISHFTA